jgi:hypothetical protein
LNYIFYKLFCDSKFVLKEDKEEQESSEDDGSHDKESSDDAEIKEKVPLHDCQTTAHKTFSPQGSIGQWLQPS